MQGGTSEIPMGGVSCIPEGVVFAFPELWLLGGACVSGNMANAVWRWVDQSQVSQLPLFHVSHQCFPSPPLLSQLQSTPLSLFW